MTESWEQAFRDLERRVVGIEGMTQDGVFIRKEMFDVYMTQLSSDITEARAELHALRVEGRAHEEAGRARRESETKDRRAFSRSVILLVLGAMISGFLSLIVALIK